MSKKPTEIDGIAATPAKDIQQETLNIEGADISVLEEGRGIINDNHSKGFANTLGRITGAKKILKAEDCSDPRQTYFWNKVKMPYIYIKGVLFDDDEGHDAAKSCAAVIRHIHKNDTKLNIKASVEGGILERGGKDDKELKRTKITSVALTFVPSNNTTIIESTNLAKSALSPSEQAEDDRLIKNAMANATSDAPTFIDIHNKLKLQQLKKSVEDICEMTKALTAGFGGAGAPGSLTGGGVLQSESLDKNPKKVTFTKNEKDPKYITCNGCGHEQLYTENQVKCRGCNKQFKLKHLIKFMF